MACTELFCGALEQAGKTVSCEEVMKEVLSDAPFYASSGGGITLSGGEPLMQAAFALALLKSAKEQGLHTAVETCGFASADCVKSVAVWTDLFLFDYKETQKEKHLAYTSADRRVILENLALLNDLEKDIVLRCPIVPGYNDRVDHFEGIAALANAFTNILHVEVEPYHPLGEGKYQALGRKATAIDAPGEKEVWSWMDFIQRKTDKKVVKA